MSAFHVGVDHIEALLAAAERYGCGRHAGEGTFHYRFGGEDVYTVCRADATGWMLWRANAASVEARYPPGREGLQSAHEMGLIPELEERFRFNPHRQRTPSPVEALKLCACFRDQASEVIEWQSTEASAFLDALERYAIAALPGYADAPWQWRA